MPVALTPTVQQGAPVNPIAQIGGQIGNFLWGDNGQMLTPAQVAAQRQVAQAMIAQAPAPRTLGEGLSAIGKALIAKQMMDQANTSQTTGLQQATDQMTAALAPGADPNALLTAIQDPYLNPGQSSIASAMLQQRMMLTNPDMIAQRANLAADTGLKTAQANEMTTGGMATGNAFQDSNGNWFVPTQYGGARQVAGPAGPSAPNPVPLSPLPVASAATAGTPAPVTTYQAAGGTPPAVAVPGTGSFSPVVQSAPAAASSAAPVPAATTGPQFLSQAQQKGADAAATAAGTALGGAPADVNEAISGSRGANQMYAAGINNVNAALNAIANDKLGTIDTSTGIASLSKAIPGTPAYNLSKSLAALQGLSALSTMSGARSGSGGSSPVQVRNQREFEAVASAAGNLDQGQSKAQLINSLKSLKAQMLAGMNNRAQDIADLRTVGKLPGGMPASSANDPYAGPGAYGLINAAPDGRPVVTTPQEAAQFPAGTVVIMPNGQPGTVTPAFKAQFGAAQ